AVQARLRANLDALRRPARYQTQPPPRVERALYIGPNGAPGGAGAVRRPAPPRQASAPPPRQAPAPPPRRAAAPPPAPPEPPVMPSGRVRIAELAGSMLWAAPLVAILAAPATAILGIDLSTNPQQVAYLYGMSLLGTWTTLIPGKVLEGRKLDATMRRLIALGGGLALGAIGIVLAQCLRLGFDESHQFFKHPNNLEL